VLDSSVESGSTVTSLSFACVDGPSDSKTPLKPNPALSHLRPELNLSDLANNFQDLYLQTPAKSKLVEAANHSVLEISANTESEWLDSDVEVITHSHGRPSDPLIVYEGKTPAKDTATSHGRPSVYEVPIEEEVLNVSDESEVAPEEERQLTDEKPLETETKKELASETALSPSVEETIALETGKQEHGSESLTENNTQKQVSTLETDDTKADVIDQELRLLREEPVEVDDSVGEKVEVASAVEEDTPREETVEADESFNAEALRVAPAVGEVSLEEETAEANEDSASAQVSQVATAVGEVSLKGETSETKEESFIAEVSPVTPAVDASLTEETVEAPKSELSNAPVESETDTSDDRVADAVTNRSKTEEETAVSVNALEDSSAGEVILAAKSSDEVETVTQVTDSVDRISVDSTCSSVVETGAPVEPDIIPVVRPTSPKPEAPAAVSPSSEDISAAKEEPQVVLTAPDEQVGGPEKPKEVEKASAADETLNEATSVGLTEDAEKTDGVSTAVPLEVEVPPLVENSATVTEEEIALKESLPSEESIQIAPLETAKEEISEPVTAEGIGREIPEIVPAEETIQKLFSAVTTEAIPIGIPAELVQAGVPVAQEVHPEETYEDQLSSKTTEEIPKVFPEVLAQIEVLEEARPEGANEQPPTIFEEIPKASYVESAEVCAPREEVVDTGKTKDDVLSTVTGEIPAENTRAEVPVAEEVRQAESASVSSVVASPEEVPYRSVPEDDLDETFVAAEAPSVNIGVLRQTPRIEALIGKRGHTLDSEAANTPKFEGGVNVTSTPQENEAEKLNGSIGLNDRVDGAVLDVTVSIDPACAASPQKPLDLSRGSEGPLDLSCSQAVLNQTRVLDSLPTAALNQTHVLEPSPPKANSAPTLDQTFEVGEPILNSTFVKRELHTDKANGTFVVPAEPANATFVLDPSPPKAPPAASAFSAAPAVAHSVFSPAAPPPAPAHQFKSLSSLIEVCAQQEKDLLEEDDLFHGEKEASPDFELLSAEAAKVTEEISLSFREADPKNVTVIMADNFEENVNPFATRVKVAASPPLGRRTLNGSQTFESKVTSGHRKGLC